MKKVDISDWLAEYVEDHDIQNGGRVVITIGDIELCTVEVTRPFDETIEFNIKRVFCDLCEEKRASIRIKNKYNGAILNVCADCYEEVWGGEYP